MEVGSSHVKSHHLYSESSVFCAAEKKCLRSKLRVLAYVHASPTARRLIPHSAQWIKRLTFVFLVSLPLTASDAHHRPREQGGGEMDGKKMRWMSIKVVRDGGGNRGKEGKRSTCWGAGSATNGDGSSEQMMDEASHACACVRHCQNVWCSVHVCVTVRMLVSLVQHAVCVLQWVLWRA